MLNILDGYNIAISRPPAFTGATGNTRGDKDGTMAAITLFEVFGLVKAIVFGKCTVTGVGAGTIEVGVAGNTALFLAPCVDATTIAAGDFYVDASVAEMGGFATLPAGAITDRDIIETTSAVDVTAGQIYYVCLWKPITDDGLVVARYPNAD